MHVRPLLILSHQTENTHRQRRRDSTVELRRVGGVYWALGDLSLIIAISFFVIRCIFI